VGNFNNHAQYCDFESIETSCEIMQIWFNQLWWNHNYGQLVLDICACKDCWKLKKGVNPCKS
jgi:hypothetical protein